MNPYLFRRIRGPVFLICFAVTAVLDQWNILSWVQSWPLYLITAGILHILESAVVLGAGAPVQGVYPGMAWRGRRLRTSFSGGILLLVVGVFALLVNTGVLGSYFAWQAISVWWPLLLILVGLLLLVERTLDRGYARRLGGGYATRPRLGGSLVLLLVLLAFLGVFSHHTHFGFNNGNGWNWGDWGNGWNLGETHTNTVSFARAIPADAVLTINNADGDLQIGPSTDGQVHVTATQVAHVSDNRKNSAFAATRPDLSVNGGSVSLRVPGRDNVSVGLSLAVPPGVLCTIRNHHGDIAVSGLTHALEISQDHGDVTLDSLGGSVHLSMNHGNIHARALKGDLTVDGRTDDVTASGVAGRTTLHGEFFGDTDLEQLGGPVDFQSNRTQIEAQHITGDLTLDAGDLNLSGVSGGLTLNTHSKDVDVSGLSGDAQISDSNGDLSVSTVKPLGALTLHENTGDLTLSIPQGAAFRFSGSNRTEDDFSSDFTLSQTASGNTRTVVGQVGNGGPQVTAQVEHGDLTVRSVAADIEPPVAPVPPQPPMTPHAPRHSHPAAPVATPSAE